MEQFKKWFIVLVILLINSSTVFAMPTLGVISPASGLTLIDVPVSFVCKYNDASGWAHLKEAYFLVSASTTTLSSAVYLYYDQNANKLYLRDDSNTAWLGGFAPGSTNTIENSQVKLDCALSVVSGSSITMTVTFNVIFKSAYSGKTFNLYTSAKDDALSSATWLRKGTYSINQPPVLGALTPAVGASVPNQTFNIAAVYSDGDGWQNLRYAYILVNDTSTAASNCFYAYYDQNLNRLYLRDNANSTWLGGYSPGLPRTIENNYVKLDCSATVVAGSGNDLSVKWAVSFKPGFSGLKNTYVSAADDNGATVSLTQEGTWVAMDSGVAIGADGGDVVSSDGQVKLFVPAGALDCPTGISIAIVTNEALQNALPQDTAMINAVDCKPYGLVFNKPVDITYTLGQAQIPGTQIELGLYDSVQGKINPTGQKSVISADGYTVTFSVNHFSTYAALMNLVPQAAPIGGGVKIPLPDMLTGAFGHSVPLSIPPGRKGMHPTLGLTYRSGGGNSWVGLGFSLNPGYIVRSTRLGPPNYNDVTDTFYLVTDAGTTELVHLIDNLYQAKIESSFTKFYKESDDSWRAVAKEGGVLRFGQTQNAKETAPSGTYSWYLTRAQDTNGNYMQYGYSKDQGKTYLSRIDYTGNDIGVSPTNSVEFNLESRDDVFSSYISTSKIVTAKRLKEIQVKVNSVLVWRYSFEYSPSPDTSRSLLTSVTQYANDNKNLPVQRFSYQKSDD